MATGRGVEGTYERRRWLIDRDQHGIPARACECRTCPERLASDLVPVGSLIGMAVERVLGGQPTPYWQGATCAEERFPQFADQFRRCESPIEVSMLCALYDCFAYEIAAGRASIEAQAELPGGYRADILITDSAGARYDIECDGCEFHETESDRIRDARLAHADIRVPRYPGAGIVANRRARASEVFLLVSRTRRMAAGMAA